MYIHASLSLSLHIYLSLSLYIYIYMYTYTYTHTCVYEGCACRLAHSLTSASDGSVRSARNHRLNDNGVAAKWEAEARIAKLPHGPTSWCTVMGRMSRATFHTVVCHSCFDAMASVALVAGGFCSTLPAKSGPFVPRQMAINVIFSLIVIIIIINIVIISIIIIIIMFIITIHTVFFYYKVYVLVFVLLAVVVLSLVLSRGLASRGLNEIKEYFQQQGAYDLFDHLLKDGAHPIIYYTIIYMIY